MGAEVVFPIAKGWLAIATLKPTFTFIGRDFVKVLNMAKSLRKVGFSFALGSQPLEKISLRNQNLKSKIQIEKKTQTVCLKFEI